MVIISFLMGYHNLIYECVGTPLVLCFRFAARIHFGWMEERNEPHHKCKQKNATDNVLDFSRQHIILYSGLYLRSGELSFLSFVSLMMNNARVNSHMRRNMKCVIPYSTISRIDKAKTRINPAK